MKTRAGRLLFTVLTFAVRSVAQEGRQEILLTGPGWHLWHDKEATWKDDPLFLPPVDLAKVPANAPTGGWNALESSPAMSVAVPGTVEEYLQTVPGPAGDLSGVSWWWRAVQIPAARSPRRLLLRFDAVRQRAEVYVNHRLVGYDLIGNSPFEVDITDAAKPGETIELAVRVTDPGGNLDWRDGATIAWGKNRILGSHAFGGITGRVALLSCDPVYVDNIYLQNTPAVTDVNARITIRNTMAAPVQRDLVLRVFPRGDHTKPLWQQELKAVALTPGETVVPVAISAPAAKPWDVEQPNLYSCDVELRDAGRTSDATGDTFGFRWFAPDGIGKDAMFRLNGKRIVLRSAISWGFFPINGIYATPEIAERQVRTAKAMGQNMLHFHRAIGQPVILDQADQLGLLYYEEPGNYRSGDGSELAGAMGREKLLRMVKRDRNHPSLVIFNMINEDGAANAANLARRERDLRDAQAIDPSRTITRTSAWATKPGFDSPDEFKLHVEPFDPEVHHSGWYDFHHAGGPAVWMQSLYQDPTDYYNRTDDKTEIVFWGEEGAISTPPRLEKIKAELERAPHTGWDGQMYLDWYREFDAFLGRKNLRAAFPSVDAFTTALGAVSFEHQGRKIELVRLDNTTDGYTINGWESMIVENHSGIVDCFRFPKSDPAIIAYYNQPLYIAVKSRQQVTRAGDEVTVDFHAINENNLRGPHTLVVTAKNPAGQTAFSRSIPVSLAGGDVYGQLLAADVKLRPDTPGKFRIEAQLLDPLGAVKAAGREEILAVDWQGARFSERGAVWGGEQVRSFLKAAKNLDVPAYSDGLGKLDWLVVGRAPGMGQPVVVPKEAFQELRATFLDTQKGNRELASRPEGAIALAVADGATPDPAVPLISNYGVRWEGKLVPTISGLYALGVQAGSAGARVWLDGKEFVSSPGSAAGRWASATIALTAGVPVAVRVEYSHRRGDGRCRLMWSPPDATATDLEKLMTRVRGDGTTLVVLDFADTWMELIAKHTGVKYSGSFKIGTAWAGGIHFVREHPLFKDLPVNGAMDWPYQAVVRNGNERSGLLLEGEELVAGAWHANLEAAPQHLGTAVGVIPYGKGRIIVSTLDIVENLPSPETPAHVARKLLCNYLEFASKPNP
jgi:beta-galactosidase